MTIRVKKQGQRLCSFKPETLPQTAIVENMIPVSYKVRKMSHQQISNIQFNLHREAKRRIALSH